MKKRTVACVVAGLLGLLLSNVNLVWTRPLSPALLDSELAGLSELAGAPDTEKKQLPPVNWPRTRRFDVKHLLIDLRFDWQKKQAYGTTTITLTPFNSTETIALDAALLTISSITTPDGAALKFVYDGGEKSENLQIALGRVYAAGEELAIKIEYHTNWVSPTDLIALSGSNGKGLRFFEPTANDPNRPREIWSSGDPEANRYWFPGYDSPNDPRTTEFIATVAKGLTVIANGRLVATKDNPDGTRTFHWQMDTPYANHLTSFVVGEYVDVQQQYQDVELHNYGYRNETEAVAATVVRLPDMIKFYSEFTGVKYPYPRYSQVFVQDLPWGLGNRMLATQSENMIDDARIHAEYFYLWDGLEAEALAQQWFGNYVTSRDWSQVWLNRGFAHYFDGLYNEYKNGRAEFLLWQVLADHNTYLADWDAGFRHPIVTRNYENPDVFTTDNYPNVRGAMVLHMLRKHLGEDNWRKAIRHYLQTNANQPVTTEDLSKAIAEATGESMDWFFDQWLYKMGHPVFVVTKNYDATKQQLTLNVRQTQKLDPNEAYPQVEFFAGKVDVELDDHIEQVWLEPKAENVFTFSAPQSPKLVNFDYESSWIKAIKFEKSPAELLYQMQNDRDVLGQRWAMSELASLAKNESTTAAEKAGIYAGLRSMILSNSYWRLRLAAIAQLQSLVVPATSTTNPVALDEQTITTLVAAIKREKSWNRATAINFLGLTGDARFVDIYLGAMDDESDRVINAAAAALGRSKSRRAFAALAKLAHRPSWKNQSLISALNGLKLLGDARGFEIAFKALSDPSLTRWRLPTPPVWDYRVFAVETIVALGKADAAYPLILARFQKAMAEDDLHGVFNNVLLLIKLGDGRGREVFPQLRAKYKDDANVISAVNQYETQFQESVKSRLT